MQQKSEKKLINLQFEIYKSEKNIFKRIHKKKTQNWVYTNAYIQVDKNNKLQSQQIFISI